MKNLLLFGVLFVGISLQVWASKQDTQTMTGVIRLTTDDTGSNVLRVDLLVMVEKEQENGELSSDILEYRVVDNDLSLELHELDGILIEVTGQVSGDTKSGLQIEVESYTIIEETEENFIDEP